MKKLITLFTLLFCIAPFSLFAQDAKVLVVFYSRTGNTKVICEEIAKKINADTEQLVDTKDRSGKLNYIAACKDATLKNETKLLETKKDPSKYDLIILIFLGLSDIIGLCKISFSPFNFEKDKGDNYGKKR